MRSASLVGTSQTFGAMVLQANAIYSGALTPVPYTSFLIPWIATARDLTNPSDVFGSPVQDAIRTSSRVFMRGLAENIRISTDSSMPWEWRRICFTFKGNALIQRNGTTAVVFPALEIAPEGVVRQQVVLTTTASTDDMLAIANQYCEHLFEGVRGRDYTDLITAKTDTRQVTIKYDKMTVIQSPNDSGVQRTYKRWHPMNANLVYDEEEAGYTTNQSSMSVESKPGMGDYYVLDIYRPHPGAGAADHLQIQPQSTLYWHER